MIVDYFNVTEPESVQLRQIRYLVIDTDAVLTVTISSERVQAVSGRHPRLVQDRGLVESTGINTTGMAKSILGPPTNIERSLDSLRRYRP